MLMVLRWDCYFLTKKEKGMMVINDEWEKMMWESVCLRQVMGCYDNGWGLF